VKAIRVLPFGRRGVNSMMKLYPSAFRRFFEKA
jgi:hypothetical protein